MSAIRWAVPGSAVGSRRVPRIVPIGARRGECRVPLALPVLFQPRSGDIASGVARRQDAIVHHIAALVLDACCGSAAQVADNLGYPLTRPAPRLAVSTRFGFDVTRRFEFQHGFRVALARRFGGSTICGDECRQINFS